MKHFILGLLAGILFFGCAGVTFPYKYYKPELTSWEGTLFGAKPSDDLDGSVCAPDSQTDGKCVVMLRDEFFKMKLEFEDLEQRLISCESHSGGSK